MLRGNSPAKIDDKGRLKVPNGFRVAMQDEHGRELFVTSLSGESVRIYPMPVWIEQERKLAQLPTTNPSRQRYLDRVNVHGQHTERDTQGRVLIPQRLRESAQIVGDVDVFGQFHLLEVWNHERFMAKMQREPYTEADARALSDLGI